MNRQEVVPVGEFKKQVEKRNRQKSGSVYVQFQWGANVTWNKCPCTPKEVCIDDTHCYGYIFIDISGWRADKFLIKVIAIKKDQETYIEMGPQYHELIDRGKFKKCKTTWVQY